MINKCLKKSTSTELKIAIETLMDFLNGIRIGTTLQDESFNLGRKLFFKKFEASFN